MKDAMVRHARRAAEAGNAQTTRHPSGQRGRVFSGRVLLAGLGLAVAWGLFLWFFIGGSIASFGNPWLSS
jgi:hypothetical protein